MKLQELSIKNFKSFDEVKMENIQDLNFLIGRNNAGKSNLFTALKIITSKQNPTIKDINYNSKSNLIEMCIKVELSKIEVDELISKIKEKINRSFRIKEYENTVESSIRNKLNIIIYKIGREIEKDGMSLSSDIYLKSFDPDSTIDVILKPAINIVQPEQDKRRLTDTVVRQIVDYIDQKFYFLSPIRDPQHIIIAKEKSDMNFNARDLISLIYSHKNKETPEFSIFEEAVIKIIPEITRIFTPPDEQNITIGVKEKGYSQTKFFDLSQLSSGIIETISIIARIIFTPKGSIICIDSPEVHFHPFALYRLKEFFKQISRIDKKKQLFITTHSHSFFIFAEINELWHFEKDDNGISHIKQLNEEKEIDEVEKDMTSH